MVCIFMVGERTRDYLGKQILERNTNGVWGARREWLVYYQSFPKCAHAWQSLWFACKACLRWSSPEGSSGKTTFPVPGLRWWCGSASVKSRVQIPSTQLQCYGRWRPRLPWSLLATSPASAQREIPSQRNELASDTAGPRHPTLTSRIHRPMQARMPNYTICMHVYHVFKIEFIEFFNVLWIKEKRCWEIHSHSENFDVLKAIVPYWILCFLRHPEIISASHKLDRGSRQPQTSKTWKMISVCSPACSL